MNHRIRIKNFGPIKDFETVVNDFNILTGPQASGKSTVAKVVYFCSTLKDELKAQLTMLKRDDIYEVPLVKGIEKRLRGKFLRIFGSTWAMPMDMDIMYKYRDNVTLHIYLEKDRNDENRNFVEFELSTIILDFLKKLEHTEYAENEKIMQIQNELDDFFLDHSKCVYVPAGRGMISLLTDQLNYIFSSTDDMVSATIDYCTRAYVELILQMRPSLQGGLRGLLEEKLRYTQDKVDKTAANMMMEFADKVLKGRYRYVSGEERFFLDQDHYVKINYASTGQQESVWIFNLMFYYLLNRRKIFFILEEPEAHLYPEAQYNLSRALGLFYNRNNLVMLTTHSPYMLGTLNTMLYADKIPENRFGDQTVIEKECVLDPQRTNAVHMDNGNTRDAMEDGLILNELIDGISDKINKDNDIVMDLIWKERGSNVGNQ